ncbi:MAG: hypothetical protein ISN29_00895 [Gammaproteobacteria bacterium AqS3]|nr:hypothetical protein [Gammaproteobacteria bacterium AqS3]
MGIHVRLFVEDQLTRDVVEKMLRQTEQNYSVLEPRFWNKDEIRMKVRGLNHAAKEHGSLYLVVTNQDTLANCPAGAVENLGAPLSANLLYRFAVMEIEAWVMADRENFADYLSVDIRSVPQLLDEVPKPKEKIVAIARKSRSKNIRDDLIPRHSRSSSKVGPNYGGVLSDFVAEQWSVSNAQKYSPSLKRTYQRLQTFQLPGS